MTIGAPQNFRFFVAKAPIYVSNVAPDDNIVRFMLHADWNSSLNVAVTVTVLDDVMLAENVYRKPLP